MGRAPTERAGEMAGQRDLRLDAFAKNSQELNWSEVMRDWRGTIEAQVRTGIKGLRKSRRLVPIISSSAQFWLSWLRRRWLRTL